MNSRIPLYAIVLAILTISLSSGHLSGNQTGGEDPPDDIPPVILTHLEGNDIVKFWAEPDQIVSVLYDQWNIILFSQHANNSFSVVVGGRTVFNGSMEAGYLNLTYNARKIDLTTVKISIGNQTYKFNNDRVNHEDIGYDPYGRDGPGKKFSEIEMNRARLVTAVGVIIASLITIPVVWMGVKAWRNKQGVVQW